MYLRHLTLLLAVQFSAQNITQKIDERVYLGTIANRTGTPYQVGLYIEKKCFVEDDRSFCGGSLITNKFVLTAAHCLENVKIMTVLLAAHSITNLGKHTVIMQTKQYKMHKDYNPITMDNDIAVVQLPKPVKLSKLIAIVNFPTSSNDKKFIIGKYGTLTGWGITSDVSKTPNSLLKKLRVLIVDDKACIGYRPTSNNICGYGEDRGSACLGDSGSPLVLENTNIQIGIVSYGADTGCTKGHANVYTNVRPYLEWIQQNSDYKIND